MVDTWYVDIPEFQEEQHRKVYVYLPESYQHELNRRYPVLYMFDGHNVFFDCDATYGKSWGMGHGGISGFHREPDYRCRR